MPPKKIKPIPELINFYELPDVKKMSHIHYNPNFELTQIKVPCRIGVIAPSGVGKTNFVMNFIKHMSRGEGSFSHIFVLHKLDETLYDYLEKLVKERVTFFKKLGDLPEPKDLKARDGTDGHVLLIIDDFVK